MKYTLSLKSSNNETQTFKFKLLHELINFIMCLDQGIIVSVTHEDVIINNTTAHKCVKLLKNYHETSDEYMKKLNKLLTQGVSKWNHVTSFY